MADTPSILVIDDDPDILASIREVLEDAGYQVTSARDGTEALAALRAMKRPAALIVDFLMPGMTGRELLEVCAADPALAGIPAIAISGDSPPPTEVATVQSFVPKPFGAEQLLTALGRLLGR